MFTADSLLASLKTNTKTKPSQQQRQQQKQKQQRAPAAQSAAATTPVAPSANNVPTGPAREVSVFNPHIPVPSACLPLPPALQILSSALPRKYLSDTLDARSDALNNAIAACSSTTAKSRSPETDTGKENVDYFSEDVFWGMYPSLTPLFIPI